MLGLSGENVNTVLAIMSIATLAGLALMRGTVVGLRESLNDARNEIADKDRRLGEAETTIEHQGQQLRGQQHDLEALGRVVTGEAHWEALTNKVSAFHEEARRHWEEIETRLNQLGETI